ncbi:uncharacterized protein Z518_01847 [Rhinocladiella mackenziei CBS 650.93]|uniref:Rhinocladiella mackenziei CBS 650.93 unplaced genomic scaffold supercont1.2, whole genome shotgun sequence n=1 Tax=Rhinocladiella mackenziei CBS 650.93 TaxID=1442369 RepID=A0A0D2IN05_9EURO|nr:uncharacterized protein Z518_01847 [Rhinocladiella mackenziei CBS 650.93]KIX07194.1 hypothetical protein Z518_01847 [Rhinocladiella mackenziei CBS 650.93]
MLAKQLCLQERREQQKKKWEALRSVRSAAGRDANTATDATPRTGEPKATPVSEPSYHTSTMEDAATDSEMSKIRPHLCRQSEESPRGGHRRRRKVLHNLKDGSYERAMVDFCQRDRRPMSRSISSTNTTDVGSDNAASVLTSASSPALYELDRLREHVKCLRAEKASLRNQIATLLDEKAAAASRETGLLRRIAELENKRSTGTRLSRMVLLVLLLLHRQHRRNKTGYSSIDFFSPGIV